MEEEATREWNRRVEMIQDFVKRLSDPKEVEKITANIEKLELKENELTKTRQGFYERREVTALKVYLIAVREKLRHGVDKKIVEEKLAQAEILWKMIPKHRLMHDTALTIYRQLFDTVSLQPERKSKDYCDKCSQPLLIMKKESFKVCKSCSQMKRHFPPIGAAGVWTLPLQQGPPIAKIVEADSKLVIKKLDAKAVKRINKKKSPQKQEAESQIPMDDKSTDKFLKGVRQDLEQFRADEKQPKIPAEVIVGVNQWLQINKTKREDKDKLSSLRNAVYEALQEVKNGKLYKDQALKILMLIKRKDVPQIAAEDIEEIMAKLKSAIRALPLVCPEIQTLASFGNYLVHKILMMKHLPEIATLFPLSRKSEIEQLHCECWIRLHNHLRAAARQPASAFSAWAPLSSSSASSASSLPAAAPATAPR